MSREAAFIAALRALATDPAARGLMDDAAVLPVSAGALVLTHDMIVEGVHFLPADPPGDVAWKLLAVNLSDLAAKSATPIGVLMGCGLGEDSAWDAAFVAGLGEALRAFDVALLGGDTVRMPPGAPRTLGLTAIGSCPAAGAPARSGARAGDLLWTTGTIGDAGMGLRIALAEVAGEHVPNEPAPGKPALGDPDPGAPAAGDARTGDPASGAPINDPALGQLPPATRALRDRYRRPQPRLAAGRMLAGYARAMADISDGLLIDAARMAAASGLAVTIDLDAVPLSAALIAATGDARGARLAAATAGDDYELLFAAPPETPIATLSQSVGLRMTAIGRFADGAGLSIVDRDGAVPSPGRLGYEHGAA